MKNLYEREIQIGILLQKNGILQKEVMLKYFTYKKCLSPLKKDRLKEELKPLQNISHSHREAEVGAKGLLG